MVRISKETFIVFVQVKREKEKRMRAVLINHNVICLNPHSGTAVIYYNILRYIHRIKDECQFLLILETNLYQMLV